ncbi:MAG: hypothetical protein HQ556_10330 [Candidatus Marinimicrobia bacterium]|nr:hypothetical protein [Candidatus Neomarinimicrobiota bacterium]
MNKKVVLSFLLFATLFSCASEQSIFHGVDGIRVNMSKLAVKELLKKPKDVHSMGTNREIYVYTNLNHYTGQDEYYVYMENDAVQFFGMIHEFLRHPNEDLREIGAFIVRTRLQDEKYFSSSMAVLNMRMSQKAVIESLGEPLMKNSILISEESGAEYTFLIYTNLIFNDEFPTLLSFSDEKLMYWGLFEDFHKSLNPVDNAVGHAASRLYREKTMDRITNF